ncbi:hypothetical protein [Microbacterium sp.]|uniref:hypothetical protein n=2 Tax=unclassified Microbacterium TaxID=2609290 RepID=UPI001AD2CF8A|nr:hypothetical protein [Microbacterium sp.]MBN9188435.1 hypothetical protein [Microbacterium sp.]MBN9192324.1 hypothetical protein [Microbacterium sp.]
MRIRLTDVAKGRRDEALPPTSLAYASGEARLALAETEQRPTVLGLIASGRMAPDAGTVTIDGRADAATLRRAVALVDAPDVCDPAPNVTVAGMVAEELMFAGRPSNPVSARRWLEAEGFGAIARTPVADVSPRERVALLLGLTALRPGVEGMVLVSPDRHGGHPAEWWELAESFADRGFAMLVVAGEAAAIVLEGRAPRADAAAGTGTAAEELDDLVAGSGGETPAALDSDLVDDSEAEPATATAGDVAADPAARDGSAPASAAEPAPEPAPAPTTDPAPARSGEHDPIPESADPDPTPEPDDRDEPEGDR